MSHTDAHLDKIMGRIQKLINRADHPNTPEHEADSCRAKAESLMREYRVEEEQLLAEDQSALAPILKVFLVTDNAQGEFAREYLDLFMAVSHHCGVRVHFSYKDATGKFTGGIYAHVVGYSSDIRFTEFLFSAARLVFAVKLEPSHDPSLSEAENIYRMRQAGMGRKEIATALWGSFNHSRCAKVGAVYKQECLRRGEQPALDRTNRTNAKTYRAVYAREFVSELRYRLSRARDAADSYGGGLELHGRKDRIDDAFYKHFPDYRPKPPPPPEQDGDGKKKGKSKAVKPYKPTKADEARVDRMYRSPSARAGTVAGRAAAQDVALTRSSTRKDRVEGNAEPSDRIALGSE